MDNRPYPSWWIDRANARHVMLANAVEKLRRHVRALPETRGILVFGSFARGDIGPDSDLDLIAVQETDLPPGCRALPLRRCLDDVLDVAYDMIVYTPQEFEELAHSRPFVMQAKAEGIWIDAGVNEA